MGAWDPAHDPEARPLGCNGKYGRSGTSAHVRRGEKACPDCRASINHFQKNLRRGHYVPGNGNWDLDHNPNRRPLGCNGRYSSSGAATHRRRGEKVCKRCRISAAHYAKEERRKGIKPRRLKPCGTNAAAERHRAKGEELCFDCKMAIARRAQEYRDSKKVMDVHQ